MNKQLYIDYLNEIKSFFGAEWFQGECNKAGVIPDPRQSIHPMVYFWIQTDNFINNKVPITGINLVPKYELLSVRVLGTYLRLIAKAKISDLTGKILDLSLQDIFRNRLRSIPQYYSTLYEMEIASLYLRKGYEVNFIHDTQKHPEFLIKTGKEDIYVECKSIRRKVLEKDDENNLNQLYNKLEKTLIEKNAGVLVVCDGDFTNENNWMLKVIQELVNNVETHSVHQVNEHYFKTFPALLKTSVYGYDLPMNGSDIHNKRVMDYLEEQLKEFSLLSDNIVFYPSFNKVTIETPFTCHHEMQSCFCVAFRTTPNIISGIKKMINKAYNQLPKESIGLVYVACPPANTSLEEAKEFWRDIDNELNSITRIYALIVTGTEEEEQSFTNISVVKRNNNCKKLLPPDFQVLPLLDKFSLD